MLKWGALGAMVIVVLALIGQSLRPLPAVAASSRLPAVGRVEGTPPVLPWPAQGTAAVGATGLGMIGAKAGSERPLPMASVAKVMTALVVLDDKPLKKGERGPVISVTQADVDAYQRAKAGGESVVPVVLGEQLTQYQAMQALLIPSGNNVADLLARWVAGDTATFLLKMNARAVAMHLDHAKFADASGISDQTVGTPIELIAMGFAAMQNPVLAEIVAQPQADLPVAGTVYNVDYALGQEGIAGVKTGSSPGAGACFVFAVPVVVQGVPVLLVGAVMGLTTLDGAFSASKQLIVAARQGLQLRRVFEVDQAVGRFAAPWGATTDLVTTEAVTLLAWPGQSMRTRLDVPSVHAPLAAGSQAGDVWVKIGDQEVKTPLVTTDALPSPGTRWRLTRLDPLL